MQYIIETMNSFMEKDQSEFQSCFYANHFDLSFFRRVIYTKNPIIHISPSAVLGDKGSKVGIGRRGKVVVPVVGHVVHGESRRARGRCGGLALGVGKGEAVGARGCQRLVPARAGERGTPRALERDLPVRRVGVRARLKDLERRAAVDAGCGVSAIWKKSVSRLVL